MQAAARQPYGGYGNAGMRHSAQLSKRRRAYRGSYGQGISRVPRKIHSRRGSQMHRVGAIVAGTVGGRRAHPPKPYKDWNQKINKTERRKAIRSALAATVNKDIISLRGHKIPEQFPFILDTEFEKIAKTVELETTLIQIGFAGELDRADTRKIRAGKGKMRGRKYKQPVSFLFVVGSRDVPLIKAAKNLPGTDTVSVEELNAELLAPGAHPGRLTLYTQAAIERLANEKIFTQSYKGQEAQKPTPKPKPKPKPKKKSTKKSPKSSSKKSKTQVKVSA